MVISGASNTVLHYCFFPGGSVGNDDNSVEFLPDVLLRNKPYGILASNQFPKASSFGGLYIDDEDDNNKNKLQWTGNNLGEDAQRRINKFINNEGGNTQYNIAWVSTDNFLESKMDDAEAKVQVSINLKE